MMSTNQPPLGADRRLSDFGRAARARGIVRDSVIDQGEVRVLRDAPGVLVIVGLIRPS